MTPATARRTCAVCGKDISHLKANAKTCGGGCRQEKHKRTAAGVTTPATPAPTDGSMPPDIFVTNALKAVEELEIKRIQRERETLDLLKARGDLVPFDDVAGEFAARAIAVRTKLMGVPSLFRQRMPHLALSDMEVLDALIREALEELVREESAVADDEPGDSASA